MATYAIAGNSGSAGKTTTVVSLAPLLAQRGYTVRVIELDPQANASTYLGYPKAAGPTVADIILGNATVADVERPARLIVDFNDTPIYDDAHFIDGVTIVPGNRISLDTLVVNNQPGHIVRNLQDALRDADPVDITLIDCPGSMNILVTIGLLAAASEEQHGLITCIKPAGKEIEGLPDLIQEVQNTNKLYRENLDLVSIVPCAVPASGGIYDVMMGSLRGWQGDKVTPIVRRRSFVDEAYGAFTPPPLYDTPSRRKDIVDDYNAVIDHQIAAGLYPKPRIQVA